MARVKIKEAENMTTVESPPAPPPEEELLEEEQDLKVYCEAEQLVEL